MHRQSFTVQQKVTTVQLVAAVSLMSCIAISCSRRTAPTGGGTSSASTSSEARAATTDFLQGAAHSLADGANADQAESQRDRINEAIELVAQQQGTNLTGFPYALAAEVTQSLPYEGLYRLQVSWVEPCTVAYCQIRSADGWNSEWIQMESDHLIWYRSGVVQLTTRPESSSAERESLRRASELQGYSLPLVRIPQQALEKKLSVRVRSQGRESEWVDVLVCDRYSLCDLALADIDVHVRNAAPDPYEGEFGWTTFSAPASVRSVVRAGTHGDVSVRRELADVLEAGLEGADSCSFDSPRNVTVVISSDRAVPGASIVSVFWLESGRGERQIYLRGRGGDSVERFARVDWTTWHMNSLERHLLCISAVRITTKLRGGDERPEWIGDSLGIEGFSEGWLCECGVITEDGVRHQACRVIVARRDGEE